MERYSCVNIHEKNWITFKQAGTIDWNSSFAMGRWPRWSHKDGTSYLENVKVEAIEVSTRQLYELWPPLEHSNINARNVSSHPRKGVGGAKGAFDWEKYLIEASVIMGFGNPRPNTPTELYNALLDKFGGSEGGPSLSQMKTHIGPLFNRWKEEEES